MVHVATYMAHPIWLTGGVPTCLTLVMFTTGAYGMANFHLKHWQTGFLVLQVSLDFNLFQK